jgi:hypothetical protein
MPPSTAIRKVLGTPGDGRPTSHPTIDESNLWLMGCVHHVSRLYGKSTLQPDKPPSPGVLDRLAYDTSVRILLNIHMVMFSAGCRHV